MLKTPANPSRIILETESPTKRPVVDPESDFRKSGRFQAVPVASQGAKPPNEETPGTRTSLPRVAGELNGRFGRYKIVRPLGRGGMGTVYLAVDTQLDREVALKVPHVADADSIDVPARFRQEARAAARLAHTNICAVHDVGQIDGVHYLTMAYVDGKPLSDRLRGKKPMAVRQAVDLVGRLALALQYAHCHGVIHRDLKPANIMMNDHDDPIIMDFGLARRCDTHSTRLTLTGEALGTLAYMPPEQLRGELSQIGPHSDVYSLGVILFELLTGRLPFEGTPAQIIGKLLREEPRPVAHYQPGLSGSPLNAIVQKAMKKAVSERFPSMAAFADALVSASPARAADDLAGSVAESARDSHRTVSSPRVAINAPKANQRPERRRRNSSAAKVVLAASLLLMLLAGGSAAIWNIVALLDFEKPVTTIEIQPKLSVVVGPSIHQADGSTPDSKLDASEPKTDPSIEIIKVAPQKIVSIPKADNPSSIQADAFRNSTAEAIEAWQRHIDAANDKLANRDLEGARADLTSAANIAPDNGLKAQAVLQRARINHDRADYESARVDAEHVGTLDKTLAAESAIVLAQVYCQTWDFDLAIEACDRVSKGRPQFPCAQAHRALALAGKHEWVKAKQVVADSLGIWGDISIAARARATIAFRHEHDPRRAVQILDPAIDRNPKDAALYILRAKVLIDLRRFDDAIKDCDEAARLSRFLEPHVCRLQAFAAKDQYLVAKPVFGAVDRQSRIVTMSDKRELGPKTIDAVMELRNPQTADEWILHSLLWRMKNDRNKALEACHKAVALRPKAALALLARAKLHYVRNESGQTADDCGRVLAMSPGNAAALYLLGELKLIKHAYSEAMQFFLDAERSEPRFVDAIWGRAAVLKNQKKFDKAIEACTAGLEIDPNHSGLRFIRSFARSELNDIDGAILDCDKSVEVSPDAWAAFNNRGSLWGRKREWTKAIADFTESIRLHPNNAPAYSNRAKAHTELGRHEDAAADRRAAAAFSAGEPTPKGDANGRSK